MLCIVKKITILFIRASGELSYDSINNYGDVSCIMLIEFIIACAINRQYYLPLMMKSY